MKLHRLRNRRIERVSIQSQTLRQLSVEDCRLVAGGMKLITAVVKPFKLDDVRESYDSNKWKLMG